WPPFACVCGTARPPPPPPLAPEAVPLVKPKTWNPRTIAWLGLLFSPVWMGIMATINGRRLGIGLPLWRPLLIGIGAPLFDWLVEAVLVDSLIVHVGLYLGSLWSIWYLDLGPQAVALGKQDVDAGQRAGWLIPTL